MFQNEFHRTSEVSDRLPGELLALCLWRIPVPGHEDGGQLDERRNQIQAATGPMSLGGGADLCPELQEPVALKSGELASIGELALHGGHVDEMRLQVYVKSPLR